MSAVDVVIPCYNYAHYLTACVDSVLSQSGVDVRVLILDDASPDNTPEVGGALAARDPRVTYRRHPQNMGLIPTINDGVFNWAESEHLLILSADDLISAGALARAAAVLDAHGDVGMVYGFAYLLQGDQAPQPVDDGPAQYTVISGPTFLAHCCGHGNPVPTPTAVVRTALQKTIGPYNPELRHTSDMDTWMRLATVSRIGVVHAIQGYYRWHGGNMSAAYHGQSIGDRGQQLATCRSVLAGAGGSVPGLADWVSGAAERFRRETVSLAHEAFDAGATSWRDILQEGDRLFGGPRWTGERLKLHAKALVGYPAVSALRRRLGRPGDRSSASSTAPDVHGQITGWLPASDRLPF